MAKIDEKFLLEFLDQYILEICERPSHKKIEQITNMSAAFRKVRDKFPIEDQTAIAGVILDLWNKYTK